MLFQYLSGFEPILYTTHTNEEPIKLVFKDNEYVFSYSRAAIKYISRYCDVGEFMLEEKASQRSRMWIYIIVVVFIIVWCLMFGRGK